MLSVLTTELEPATISFCDTLIAISGRWRTSQVRGGVFISNKQQLTVNQLLLDDQGTSGQLKQFFLVISQLDQ